MNRKYLYLRRAIACLAGVLFIAAFVGKFYPIKFLDVQFVPLLQNAGLSVLAFGLLWLIVGVTLVFGRVYCSTVCPLGLFQELLSVVFRRKMKPQKNRAAKYFIAAVAFGALVGGTACLIRLIDPYSQSGAAMSGALSGMVVLAIVAVLTWFKGRYFCTNICPVGAVLGVISRYSLLKVYIKEDSCISCGRCARDCPSGCIDFKNKQVGNETCVKCLKCLNGCPKSALAYGIKTQSCKQPHFSPERRKLLVSGAVLAVFAAAARGGIELSKIIARKARAVIVPAGGKSAEEFANRCLNCNLCVQTCPMKILKKADGEYPAVHIDYADSFCDFDCHKCAEVCPSGAIERIGLAQKQKTQIAIAEIDEKICIKCGLCIMKCPRETISRDDSGAVHIDTSGCIGCGACKQACPVKAISVAATEQQKIL